MQEFVAPAIILNKDPLRDLDGRYSFFTERWGKVIGKTTSSRKIISKLAPHLEPGAVSRVRWIERNGTQIVDALSAGRLSLPLPDLHTLHQLLPEGVPERDLWKSILTQNFSWPHTLALLGWDPGVAHCVWCKTSPVNAFHIPRQDFFCLNCASKLRRSEVLLL